MKKRKVTMETLKKVAIDYVNNRADTHRLAYELNAYREQNPDADIKLAKKAVFDILSKGHYKEDWVDPHFPKTPKKEKAKNETRRTKKTNSRSKKQKSK
tara:strand:+ start:2635 stop:2931 length:297 start_codon:yes stop_codon:yes gene_type:complete